MPTDDVIAALRNRLDMLEMTLALVVESANAQSRALVAALARQNQLEDRMSALVAAATARELVAAGSASIN